MGLYIGAFSLVFGFAMTWHIFWLGIASFAAILVCMIIRLSGKDEHDLIPASEVKEIEARLASLRHEGEV
jgi:cytochrome o ubiquinol oxidase subunit 1